MLDQARMRLDRRTLLLPLVIACVACTSFGVADGAGGSDAGAGSDGGTSGSDAATGGEASTGSSYCAGHPALFCADFDGAGQDVLTGWSSLVNGGNTNATAVVDARARSAPGAALFKVPRGAPASSRLELRRIGVPFATKQRFGFDVYPVKNGGYPDSITLAYVSFGPTCAFDIAPGEPIGSIFVEQDGSGAIGKNFALAMTVPTGHWGRFEIVFRLGRAHVRGDHRGQDGPLADADARPLRAEHGRDPGDRRRPPLPLPRDDR